MLRWIESVRSPESHQRVLSLLQVTKDRHVVEEGDSVLKAQRHHFEETKGKYAGI